MPINTWRSYATKVRKKQKSDWREYTRGNTRWETAEASNRYRDEQSGEVQEEKEEVKLRPPIEVYEALDDQIEQHLEKIAEKPIESEIKPKTRKKKKAKEAL